MKLLIVINSPYQKDLTQFPNVSQLNFQPLFHSPLYDVHRLMAGAKDNNGLAEAEIKRIIGQPRLPPLGIDVVKELYKNTEDILIIDGAFLQASEVAFILETVDSTYNNVILHYDNESDDVLTLSYTHSKEKYTLHRDDITLDVLNSIAKGVFDYSKFKANSLTSTRPQFTSRTTEDSSKVYKSTPLNDLDTSKDTKDEKLKRINTLLDEVDKELLSLSSTKEVDPLDLSLTDLLEHLKTEWGDDEELKTLALRDVVTLLGFKLIPLKEE